MQHLRIAIKAAAARPRQTYIKKSFDRAETFNNLQTSTGDADRATPETHRIVRFQQNHRHAVVGEAESGAIADWASPDNDYRPPARVDAALQGW